jgi:hypothetical protein
MTNEIRLGINDYGTPHRIQLYPEDGKWFTHAELSLSTFLFRIYRKDSIRLPCSSSNDKIYPSDINKLHYYEDAQNLIIGNEVMTVDGDSSVEGKYVNVTRVEPSYHRKQSLISHIIFESSSVVTYDGTAKALYLTPEIDMVKYSGTYQFLVQIDTGSRKSTVKKSGLNNPFLITFIPEV